MLTLILWKMRNLRHHAGVWHPPTHTPRVVFQPGDKKLAHNAQMYHYQHQKQQMLSMERWVILVCWAFYQQRQTNERKGKLDFYYVDLEWTIECSFCWSNMSDIISVLSFLYDMIKGSTEIYLEVLLWIQQMSFQTLTDITTEQLHPTVRTVGFHCCSTAFIKYAAKLTVGSWNPMEEFGSFLKWVHCFMEHLSFFWFWREVQVINVCLPNLDWIINTCVVMSVGCLESHMVQCCSDEVLVSSAH